MLWDHSSCQSSSIGFSKRSVLSLGLVVVGFTGQASAFNSTLEALRSQMSFQKEGFVDQTDSFPSGVFTGDEVAWMEELPGPIFADGTPVVGDIPTGVNNQKWTTPTYEMYGVDFHTACLKVTDAANTKRYQIPESVVPLSKKKNPNMKPGMLGLSYTQTPFSFNFYDQRDPTQVYVSSEEQKWVFNDKFIRLDLKLASQRIFGFGERVSALQLKEGAYESFNFGFGEPYDPATAGNQAYGTHPFVMFQGVDKSQYFGMYFHNSNAQVPVITYEANDMATFTYITTGGIIEVYFFTHGSPQFILQQYHNLIGKPHLPPFWTMGFQQGSWTYKTQSDVQAMVNEYKKAGIPLEAAWIDIPYMKDYADFSIDTTAFPDMKTFTEGLHANNQKVIPILDAGLSADNLDDKYYKDAQTKKALIQSIVNPTLFEGALTTHVWPTHTVFLDYFKKDARDIWQGGITDLFAQFEFDGLWLDMNEVTGFCDGECPKYTPPKTPTLLETGLESVESGDEATGPICEIPTGDGMKWYCSWADQTKESTYFLPFVPGAAAVTEGDKTHFQWMSLDKNTLSLNATHTDDNNNVYKEYDVHNLFGLMEQQATFEFKGKGDRRPFMLSRATFASSGKYSSHWLGDNFRQWNYMKYSVSGIMNMNMFGVPHTGADVCGFFGDKDDEMCGRWIQLATFYPFARNHYNLTNCVDGPVGGECPPAQPSEPYTLASPWKELATDAIFDRLSAARHTYTQLAKVHKYGGSMFSPLFYQFPEEETAYNYVESSIMVGDQLKVTPIYKAKVQNGIYSYFPGNTVWVNLFDLSQSWDTTVDGGIPQFKLVEIGNHVLTHLKSGSIIPWQFNDQKTMTTTTDMFEKGKIALIAFLDKEGAAQGELFLDDGISQSSLTEGKYDYHNFQFSANSLKRFIVNEGFVPAANTQSQFLDKVVIAQAMDIKDYDFACSVNQNDVTTTPVSHTIAYDDKMLTLTITPTGNVKFTDFTEINYGKKGVHPNPCDPDMYTYTLASDVNLESPMAHIILDHKAGIWPSVVISLFRYEFDIINMEVNYFNKPDDFKEPFVPELGIPKMTLSEGLLSDFVSVTNKPSFGIQFGVQPQPVLDTTGMDFAMSQFFNRFGIKASINPASPGIWGLGDHYSTDLFLSDGIYSQFNRDQPDPLETGKLPAANTYGTHPFWMFGTSSTLPEAAFAGVFLKNTHAADFQVENDLLNSSVGVTATTIGGKIDLYFMTGYIADEVVTKYHSIIGQPVRVPRWALGWNQCEWGWETEADEAAVVTGYANAKIPLDVMWSDIDYMNEYRDFTVDPTRYAGQAKYVDDLHAKDIKYVPIVDAAIAYRPQATDPYAYYNGATDDFFIKGADGKTFIGRVWPNDAAYPDWTSAGSAKYWQKGIDQLKAAVDFDGLWLDMNEASNFCNGACYKEQVAASPIKNKLPYIPTGRDLEIKAISLDAMHFDGSTELDQHNLFSIGEVKATHEWFQAKKQRTMIISRASVAGQGKYGSRWLGDNYSTIEYLAVSVPGIMNSNMYGMPLSGVDICGFIGDTTPELCARWTVIGAMYPFSRNHNNYGSIPQEPYQKIFEAKYTDGQTFQKTMIDGIKNKYAITRYMYSEMMNVSHAGGQVYRPVFYSYPEDPFAWDNNYLNWMIGYDLKISANTYKLGQDETSFYFPAGHWCNIFDDTCYASKGQAASLSTKPQDIYAHLAEGSIIPWNDPTNVLNQYDLIENHEVSFKINPTFETGDEKVWIATNAHRPYYNDNGETIEETSANVYEITAGTLDAKLPSRVTISFTMKEEAFKYKDNTQPGCYHINMGDYLGDIYIYNAELTGITQHSYKASYVYADGSKELLVTPVTMKNGVAIVPKRTDKALCLGYLVRVVLIPDL